MPNSIGCVPIFQAERADLEITLAGVKANQVVWMVERSTGPRTRPRSERGIGPGEGVYRCSYHDAEPDRRHEDRDGHGGILRVCDLEAEISEGATLHRG